MNPTTDTLRRSITLGTAHHVPRQEASLRADPAEPEDHHAHPITASRFNAEQTGSQWAMLRELLSGPAAGAAGTTALNAATYADMAWRGRPSSRTPEQTVDAIADRFGFPVAGTGEARANRRSGLGALSGIVTGVGIGALVGLLRAAGLRLPVIPVPCWWAPPRWPRRTARWPRSASATRAHGRRPTGSVTRCRTSRTARSPASRSTRCADLHRDLDDADCVSSPSAPSRPPRSRRSGRRRRGWCACCSAAHR